MYPNGSPCAARVPRSRETPSFNTSTELPSVAGAGGRLMMSHTPTRRRTRLARRLAVSNLHHRIPVPEAQPRKPLCAQRAGMRQIWKGTPWLLGGVASPFPRAWSAPPRCHTTTHGGQDGPRSEGHIFSTALSSEERNVLKDAQGRGSVMARKQHSRTSISPGERETAMEATPNGE
jgi:hypothetical protein